MQNDLDIHHPWCNQQAVVHQLLGPLSLKYIIGGETCYRIE